MKNTIENLDLSYAVINTKPIAFDFGNGWTETWNGAVNQTDDEIETLAYATMFSDAIYPLGDDFFIPEDVSDRLHDCTIIHVSNHKAVAKDGYYLVAADLSKDMNWNICRSYVDLGFYPPIHFLKLGR